MMLVLFFICGIFVGSFLNVLIDRLPREESPIKGRSYCESCKKQLRWYDLIPLLSFIFLKAKCRYCRTPLSYYYPLVELTTGVVFVVTAFFVGNNFQFLIFDFQSNPNFQLEKAITLGYYLFIVSALIVIFFIDLKYGIIPDSVTFFGILIVSFFIIFGSFTSKDSWFHLVQPAAFEVGNKLLSALGGFLFFLFIFLATRGRGMGFGDVKFVFLIGLIVGFPNIIVALYTAFLTGAFISVMLILTKKKKLRGSTVPFGPFLAAGTLIALFWGNAILRNFLPFLALK